MPHPFLIFCPYLPLSPDGTVSFANWELGSLQSFENRWADSRFKAQATAFLGKFIGRDDKPIKPALLCREGKQLDGLRPSDEEIRALELSLAFAFVDRNPPMQRPEDIHNGWAMVTADNTELYVWPIDLEQGHVTLCTGSLVTTNIGGYKINDQKLVLRPPLDLHMPILATAPDRLVLTAVYETVLRSLLSPGRQPTADQIRVAVEWFVKAWLNSQAIQWRERLVYLKTAFEALTGTSATWKSARMLREMFEALPHTTKEDAEVLVWSPAEEPVHTRTWVGKNGQSQSSNITDLEQWVFAFGEARNTIIHEGELPDLTYCGSNPAYNGPFFWTAEFLLRGVIKVRLSELGYHDVWRPELWRIDDAVWDADD